jgi:hypothetical protein
MLRSILAAAAALTLALSATASAEVITPEFKAGDFASNNQVTNPYNPLTPGTVLYYKGRREGKASSDTFTVTSEKATILGVITTVIHDQGFIGGKLHENTTDWYAQDITGNVWYFGEATEELNRKGEQTSTEGSWQAGVKGAKPGIFMPAKPEVGVGFKQEIAPEISEDEFEVASLNTSVTTPYISTNRAMRTKEFSPLEKGVLDNKIFALGIGAVVEVTIKGPEDHLELVKVKRP